MSTGKEKCEKLRRIRREVAEYFDLEYHPTECRHEGDCSGTCPKCDEELKELQRQLESRGITDFDITDIPVTIDEDESDNDISIRQGDVAASSDDDIPNLCMPGVPAKPQIFKEKRRILYKECQIAGITFHDLKDTWDELYKGAKLALVRDKNNKHDQYAIAVALADDYDGNPDDFDFDFILGYVPRTENQHLAAMLDLGWSDAFECELSQINGSNPYKGSLYMKIYMVSKEEEEIEDTSYLIKVLELDEVGYYNLIKDLEANGCTYFRYGGFPPWENDLPKKGEKVVFMYREDTTTLLYLMYCIAVGDDDAAYFVTEKETLHVIDDSCYHVFTNIKGPVRVDNSKLEFLASEKINKCQPEDFLSERASLMMTFLFADEKPICPTNPSA